MASNDDGAPPPVGSRGPGGFAPDPQSNPRPAPLGANPELWKWFDSADEDQRDEIDATELQTALVNGDRSLFDLNTVSLLINIYDSDRNDHIGFEEFVCLWEDLEVWRRTFSRYDSDKSGTIDRAELHNALTDFGYIVTSELLDILQHKYDMTASESRSYSADPETPPGITFDRFVRACVVLRQVTKAFNSLDTDGDGQININYLQFLQTFLWLPWTEDDF